MHAAEMSKYMSGMNFLMSHYIELQKTALHAACFNGHSHTTKLLIESGAMINVQAEVSTKN